ncbi:unnamed protein product, partial [Ascophyllum nodosum]
MQVGTAQVASRGVGRLWSRPIVHARSLHGTSKPVDEKKGSVNSSDWKPENWRAPTPMFGGPGLIGGNGVMTTPGVSRGFNSFGGGDGGSKDAGLKSGSAHDDNCPCCHGKEVQHGSSLDHSFSAKDGHDVPPVLKDEDDDADGDFANHPIWNQAPITHLLENNKKWVEQKNAEDPDFFKRLASVHKPEYLFIGCSDARLSVQHMLGCEAGELFVHRNVANQVMHNDLNLLTVLTYAVDYLKVKHIIVCGHYDCGGVRAAMGNHDHGLIENWIMAVKDVARLHRKELKALDDDEAIHRRLVELNVQEQCMKLFSNPVLQKSQAKNGGPFVHAMVFDVGQGRVKEL